jgi:flotillin
MTIEKLQFSLPVVFTIGPDDDRASLEKYAVLLSGSGGGSSSASKGRKATSSGRSHVQDIVKGIIEGEIRAMVGSLTMEEIFKERQIFKLRVIQNVQYELDQFGLRM